MQNGTPRLVVGAPLKNENALWATGFFAPDALVLLEKDSRRIMLTNPLEYDRARKEARVDEVLLPEDLRAGENHGSEVSRWADILLLLQRYSIAYVAVQPEFPAEIYRYLADNGISLKFADPLFPERAVKTAEEIEDIRYAQHSMEEVFPMFLEILANAEIRDGKLWSDGECVTSERLRLIFDAELMKRNCVCAATIIASGDQAADPHCLGFGPVVANTPIVFDMFPRSRTRWYWSDMSRTVVKGKLSGDARKMYFAVLDAQRKATDMVRAGVNYLDIHKAAAELLQERGFETGKDENGYHGFFHSVGHGVGLEIHEPPFARKAKATVLEPGNVITIEPGLYYKSVGGVRIEDTVVVTETGCDNLASLDKGLIELS